MRTWSYSNQLERITQRCILQAHVFYIVYNIYIWQLHESIKFLKNLFVAAVAAVRNTDRKSDTPEEMLRSEQRSQTSSRRRGCRAWNQHCSRTLPELDPKALWRAGEPRLWPWWRIACDCLRRRQPSDPSGRLWEWSHCRLCNARTAKAPTGESNSRGLRKEERWGFWPVCSTSSGTTLGNGSPSWSFLMLPLWWLRQRERYGSWYERVWL